LILKITLGALVILFTELANAILELEVAETFVDAGAAVSRCWVTGAGSV
jgi:hypothetical protein